jgi:D-3-phosphoglycerate dehydrogenase
MSSDILEYHPDLNDAALGAAIRDEAPDVLIVRGTSVTGNMLDAGQLSLIVRAGAGYNTIDVAAASRRGIDVSTCPGKNAIAVAELTFALILALDRRVPDGVAELRGAVDKKEWRRSEAAVLTSSICRLSGFAKGDSGARCGVRRMIAIR